MKAIADTFWHFLLLGCISFGGPAAHIGYFHKAFVEKLKWLSDEEYVRLLSLSQFLPGPGSSQLGFAIGLQKAGLFGGIAAFLGFTLPSFILMYCVATVSLQDNADKLFNGIIQGLKLLAVVVVAEACITMYQKFCTSKLASSIAVVTAIAILLIPSFITQIVILAVAAWVGILFAKVDMKTDDTAEAGQINYLPLVMFLVLLFGLPLFAHQFSQIQLFSNFYQTGSLVFGGGHVVLPLLQQLVGDAVAVSNDQFLLGYASAQAVPGPMFSFASFLGAELRPDAPLLAATIATVGIFLPGFLLILALKNAWQSLTMKPQVQKAVFAVNAAVVGLLISALYEPVFISAVKDSISMAAVLAGLLALVVFRIPILLLVLAFSIVGILL